MTHYNIIKFKFNSFRYFKARYVIGTLIIKILADLSDFAREIQ